MANQINVGEEYLLTDPKDGEQYWTRVKLRAKNIFPNETVKDIVVYDYTNHQDWGWFTCSEQNFLGKTPSGLPRFQSISEVNERKAKDAEERRGI